MCGAPEALTYLGARTFLVISQLHGSLSTGQQNKAHTKERQPLGSETVFVLNTSNLDKTAVHHFHALLLPRAQQDLKESILAELSASGSQADLSLAGGGSGGRGSGTAGDQQHYVTLDDVAPFKHLRRKASNESAVSSWATEER